MAAADQETHARPVRPRSYKNKSHQRGFLGAVGDLQKDGVLQDVVLEVEGRRFPCHRLVLSAASSYFRAMFTSDMAESRQETVLLQGLDADVLEEILSYIYSGTLHVSLDSVQHMYHAADLLQLDYVRDTCSSYMVRNVERSNCVDLYKFADVFSVKTVMKACLQSIARNFTEIASSEEFCSLSVNQLTEIISHEELDVKEETGVWEAVVRWVQHNKEDRLQHLPIILPHIRFNLLTPYNMVTILDHPLVREDPGRSAIRNVVKETPNQKRRLGTDTLEMALLFPERSTDEMLWMNPGEDKYIKCQYDLSPLAGTVTRDNDIYILAEASQRNCVLFKYNHLQNTWERMSKVQRVVVRDPHYPATDHLLEIDGHLFYFVVTMSAVVLKKYNHLTNKWHDCSRPQHDSFSTTEAVVSCNDRIYIFTRTVLSYDPREDQWCRKAPSDYIHQVYNAVAIGTEIFCTDYDFNKTLVYNTEADSWSELSGWQDTIHGIENIIVFVLKNKLHAVVDSWDEEINKIQLVFVYDWDEDVWSELVTLPGTSGRDWDMFRPTFPVARMYLPHLNDSQ
ncbi:kelch repeat and BTB domain-containing protein 2-like [Branchiostoma floridae x Branchiostoma belcheri]